MLANVQQTGLISLDGTPFDFTAPRLWVALIARPMREQDAADWLKNARLFAYWPCYADQVRHSRGRSSGTAPRHVRYKPVLPGYLFMAVRQGYDGDPWEVVDQAPGLLGHVRNSCGGPLTLPNEDIDIIRRIEGGLNLPFNPKTAHSFKIGDKVRFIDDLYGRWQAGTVKELAKDGRITIEVPLLGRLVPVKEIWPHQIEGCR